VARKDDYIPQMNYLCCFCCYLVLRTSENSCSTTFVNKGKKKGHADTGLGKRRHRYGSYTPTLMLRHTTKPLCPVLKNRSNERTPHHHTAVRVTSIVFLSTRLATS
jgi:hypothetical protein